MNRAPRVVDPHHSREGGAHRVALDVAVGVLVRPDGQFLMTSRPSDKVYAGYWEFPGGKFETGETVEQALRRELHEELGICITSAVPWRQELMDYPHALVRLHFCKVLGWTGALQMREGQSFTWQDLPTKVTPILPGAMPVLEWLAQERGLKDAAYLVAN